MSEVKEHKYVGRGVPRIDALAKVTGGAKFFDDVKLPSTLTGKILRSP